MPHRKKKISQLYHFIPLFRNFVENLLKKTLKKTLIYH
jgi:hypothetical protein